ncbi:hypothetical protein [Streptomyces cavernicola]|uniref:DUF4190 domain-containing protein n=1 Tax=Streptomyces cavernicola TaxID=3043613 RepID=A0ABT6SAS0_9ACTN|nr:hypothetical protein [Streptomyces sp. B-S-A6]MDI3405290.1 hypothetical protein [Streptomyces sp. B-S-A6]
MPATPAYPPATTRSDSPAVALGPTALVLGVLSTVGAWVPYLFLLALPWTIIAGGLAITLGLAGVHYARQGIGRMWPAAAGTTLGAAVFAGTIWLLWAIS